MTEAIFSLALLILLAKVLEEVATRLRQPPLLGDVLAGLLLGPLVFRVVEPGREIELFITIGIFFFFFLVGLEEIDITGFLATLRTRLFLAATLAFLTPFGLALLVSRLLGLGWVPSLAISAVIAISSLSVLAKVLGDIGRLRDHTGLQLFSITVIVELLGLVLVSVITVSAAAGEQFQALSILWLAARIVGYVLVAGVVGWWLVPWLLRLSLRYTRAQEIPFGVLMGLLLLFVFFGELSGVHGTIGALLLGVALSRSVHEFHFDVVKGFHNIAYGVFVPIFFAGAGLRLDLSFLELSGFIVAALIGVTLVGKYLGGFLAAKMVRLQAPLASASGLMAKGSLEIALLLSLLELGIIEERYFSLLMFTTLLFLLGMPSLINLVFARATHPGPVQEADTLIPTYAQLAMGQSRVGNVMSELRLSVSEETSLQDFADRYLQPGQTHYVVADASGNLVGVLRAAQVNLIPKDQWQTTKVGQVVTRGVPTVCPEDSLYSVVEKMVEHGTSLVPVIASETDRRIIGVVPRGNIIRSLVPSASAET